ncbi:putative small protein [Latilactobacillus sakei subsp. sakei LS25]|nr:putative small protein [Latilactobacillus sakei subsp. sakei LS25]
MANDFDEVGLILAILTVLGGVYLCFSLLENQEKKYKKRATKQHNKRLNKVKKRH